jgi:DNA polymerase-3 subunit alpha (Gram-positive type)
MLDEFSYLGEDDAYEVVVKNSRLIAKMCENISPLPPAKKLYPPELADSAQILKDTVQNGLTRLYGDTPPNIITDLLKREMDAILTRNYDVIYVAAQKLVDESVKNGYLVGSRGSIGSSIVAYFMDITEVNALPAHYRCPNCLNSDFDSGIGWGCGTDMPDTVCPKCGELYIKDGFNIPFETFLGFDGDKVPDIDLNFSGEFKAQAHKLTTELFGAENVYRAGTINRIAEKTAFGYVKKYLEDIGKTTTKAEENRLTAGCAGVKRTTGQHPGGLVVIPQGTEITDFCPAQHPSDDSTKNIITTHFEYEYLEDNLIKLDALGHDDPTMIKMLEDMTGVNAKDIKLDDVSTMKIFTSPLPLGLPENDGTIGATGTIGIPEFGTPFTRQMLCDTKPDNFDTLVRLSGFSHGTDVWLGNAKNLIMSGIAGVSETISCRDDIMLFLISKGIESRTAFSVSESVRRGRGLPNDTEKTMTQHGIPEWYIESCKKIKYLFPKAHAVAYVMMAFRIAWFKVNRPLAFYSAYFYRRSQDDAFDAECMINGINIVKSKIREIELKIKENKNNAGTKVKKDEDLLTTLEACYEFYLRGFEFTNLDLYDSDPTKFLPVDDKKLRPPLIAVNGLGETTAFDVETSRKNTEFISIEDLSAACSKLSKTNIEQLKKLGALRNLPDSSQFSMF